MDIQRYANSRIASEFADYSSPGLVNSQTDQLDDAATKQ